MMPPNQFWSLMSISREEAQQAPRDSKTRRDFSHYHQLALNKHLQRLSPEELIAFQQSFDFYTHHAYTYDLWGAAYWYGGGCGDDAFYNFRGNLISLGQARYEQIVKHPDDLVEVVDLPDTPYMLSQGFCSLTHDIYKEQTGNELPARARSVMDVQPAGEAIAFNQATLRPRYPKLAQRYPNMGD
jgi:hypothetical protein